MVAPTSSHPSYRLSSAPPIPVRPPPHRFFEGVSVHSGRYLYLQNVLYTCWRSSIEYERKIPLALNRKKRYDYEPPGSTPLSMSHIHHRGRGGKETGKLQIVRAKLRAAARDAEINRFFENADDVLPRTMSALSVHVPEEKRVNKLLKPRHSKVDRMSAAARIKKNSRAKTKARLARRLELEEAAINGPAQNAPQEHR